MGIPFAVHCSSCGVQLTVKKPELIGKRVACPQCKAPMLIVAPTEQSATPNPMAPVAWHPPGPTPAPVLPPTVSEAVVPEAVSPAFAPVSPSSISVATPVVIRDTQKGPVPSRSRRKPKGKQSNLLWIAIGGGVVACIAGLIAVIFWNGGSSQASSNGDRQASTKPRIVEDLAVDESSTEPQTQPAEPVTEANPNALTEEALTDSQRGAETQSATRPSADDGQYARIADVLERGETAIELGQLTQAAILLGEARGLLMQFGESPTEPQQKALLARMHYGLAGLAQRQNESAQAIAECEACLELDPDFIAAHVALAQLCIIFSDESLRDLARATQHATRACELTDWNDHVSIEVLATALAQAGNTAEAIQQLRKAMAIAPADRQDKLNTLLASYESQMPRSSIVAGSVASKQPSSSVESEKTPPATVATTTPPEDATIQDLGIVARGNSLELAATSEDEAALSKRLNDILRQRRSLFKVGQDLAAIQQKARLASETISALKQQNVQLNARLAGVTDVVTNNKLVGAIQANASQIDLTREAQDKIDDELRSARAEVNKLREAYVQEILDMRKLADGVSDQYEAVRSNPATQFATARWEQESGKKHVIARNFDSSLKKLKSFEDSVLSESIPLRRDQGGTLFVSVVIDGKHTHEMVLDSGASMISLPQSVARQCQIEVKPSDPTVVLELADGSRIEGKLVKLASVRVGKFVVENVECAVLGPEAIRAEPLLGMSFLENFKFEIDAQDGSLSMVKVETSN